jgi:metallophosphoesterase (TIGR00282 family)
MKLLFIGDIVGREGRSLVRRGARALARAHAVDLVIANCENAAAGAGITREMTDELLGAGVDVLTSGNHIWDRKEVLEFIGREPRLLRPANYPASAPGAGAWVGPARGGEPVGVINLMGRVFLSTIDDPFEGALREIAKVRSAGARVIFVDFHAEVTSEKLALSWFLDGQVSAVIGTHTHVQTADERILPGGTACLTDVGMTGPHDGVIGMDRAGVIARFTTGMPVRFEPASGDPRLHAVVITVDGESGRATAIDRVAITEAALAELVQRESAVPAS